MRSERVSDYFTKSFPTSTVTLAPGYMSDCLMAARRSPCPEGVAESDGRRVVARGVGVSRSGGTREVRDLLQAGKGALDFLGRSPRRAVDQETC